MNIQSHNQYENPKPQNGDLGQQESSYLRTGKHPDQRDDCLSINRILLAITASEQREEGYKMPGVELTEEESEHLEECRFCQRQMRSFAKLPSELRQSLSISPVRPAIIPFPRIIKRIAVAAVILLCVALTGGASLAWRSAVVALAEAAVHRQQLEKLHKATGLDQAIDIDFDTEQPNIAKLQGSINPALVHLVKVTYDNGETWQTLYDAGNLKISGPPVSFKDQKAFSVPASGKRRVTVHTRAEYMAEVIAAFPEYQNPQQTDQVAIYEVTAEGITKLIGENPTTAKPEISMGTIPLSIQQEISTDPIPVVVQHWEILNSNYAKANVWNDPTGGALVQQFKLDGEGEYTIISHAIPGATPANPTVSLEELSNIEVRFLWEGDAPVVLEPRLVDYHGKIVGTTRFIERSDKSQIIRIPAKSLKGYWGTTGFDYSHVRRLELAVARKTKEHAATGIIKVQGIELLGTAKLPPPFKSPPNLKTLAVLPLKPAMRNTVQSEQAAIKAFEEDDLLACKVNLPYDKKRDKTLPWTSFKIELEQHDFGNLYAIELELKWQGSEPIAIEPMIITSAGGDTYGKHFRIQPSTNFQKILVYPHDLR